MATSFVSTFNQAKRLHPIPDCIDHVFPNAQLDNGIFIGERVARFHEIVAFFQPQTAALKRFVAGEGEFLGVSSKHYEGGQSR